MTDKQQKFIDCYDGDIRQAAKKANISYGYGRNLMTKCDILAAIRHRIDKDIRPVDIASRQERQKFWSDVMKDKTQLMRDRLKASEMLGKSEMDFPTKTEISGVGGEPIPVAIIDYSKVDLEKIKNGSDTEQLG